MAKLCFGEPSEFTDKELVYRTRWLRSVYARLADPERATETLKGIPPDSCLLANFKSYNDKWLVQAEVVAQERGFSLIGVELLSDVEYDAVTL